ncbi:MAG: hypothetical protein R3C39_04175 [Dehalococcoidia bacterium]
MIPPRSLRALMAMAMVLCLGGLAALAVACGGDDADALVDGGATARRIEPRSPLDGPYPQYQDGLNDLHTILGTPDLGVGSQRVTFVLSDETGLVRTPAVRVRTYFFADGPRGVAGEPLADTLARFYEFPEGIRGLYSTTLEFDRSGTWGIEAGVAQPNGSLETTLFTFEVAQAPETPAVGELAPRSHNRTSEDTPPEELTTGVDFDAGLYRLTIDDAIALGRPTVVVFASPGFCTNALCGPQVELVSALRTVYGPEASYVHVELYENPSEIRSGGLEVARRTPVLEEWGLTSDEWTFILDGDGVVRARFEGFAPMAELVPAFEAVLAEAGERAVSRVD